MKKQNNYIKLIISLAVMVILIAGSYFGYQYLKDKYKTDQLNNMEAQNADQQEDAQTAQEESQENASSKAIDFTVLDANENEVTLESRIGKPVVLNFWASWCGPCKSEIPDFEKLYKEYGDDIEFVMVNLTDGTRETIEGAKKFIEKEEVTFPVYFDVNSEAAAAYQVTSIPTTYFIDDQGYLVAYAKGAMDEEMIRKGIDMIYEKGGTSD